MPIVGHALHLRSNALGFVSGLARTYGPAATFRLGRQSVVLLSRPEAVRTVLIDRAGAFTSAEFNVVLRPVLGRGLLTTDGDEHRRLRRLVQPAFGRKRVDGYRDVMVAHTERMLAAWQPGATVEMGREMQRLTLGIVAEVLLSLRTMDETGALGHAFEVATANARQASLIVRTLTGARGAALADDRLWHGPLARIPFTPQFRVIEARQILDGIVDALVARKRAVGLDTGDVASALLTARDDDGAALDDHEVRDQLMTLLGAGHATTAVAMTWTLYLLSQNPRVAAALRAELHDRLAGRPPSIADLERLPYLDLVLSESLRLYPPAWALGRLAHEEIAVAGYRFAPGTMFMLSPWVTHRLPDLFAQPHCFRPERFDPIQGERHPPHAYFPFGGGPRMCIGAAFATLEAKVLLAMIVQRFALTLVPGHPVIPSPLVVLRPAHGVRMTLTHE